MLEVKAQFIDDLFFKIKEYVKSSEKSIIPPQLFNQVEKLKNYQIIEYLFFKIKNYVKNSEKNSEKSIIPPQLFNQVEKLESYFKNFYEKIGNFNDEKILNLFKKYQATLTASQYYFLKFALRDYETWLKKRHLKLLRITEKNAKNYETWLNKIKSKGTVKDRLLRLFALYEFFIKEKIILTNPFKKVISTSRHRLSIKRLYDTKTQYFLNPNLLF